MLAAPSGNRPLEERMPSTNADPEADRHRFRVDAFWIDWCLLRGQRRCARSSPGVFGAPRPGLFGAARGPV